VAVDQYDLITVGGGLGGAALANVMSRAGKRVLVLERTREFKDRVRGEVLVPWGAAEASKLGLLEALRDRHGHELRYWAVDLGGVRALTQDMVETTDLRLPTITFFHPDMQRLVLEQAVEAGAEVLRGATVVDVAAGETPSVSFERAGQSENATARLVVGADGRGSKLRKWGGFTVKEDEHRRSFAGVLLDGMPAPDDTMHSRFAPSEGLMSWLFPQGGGRVRAYVGFDSRSSFRPLSGKRDLPRFIETSIALGVPEEYFNGCRASGPLATFDATDNWVDHPYRDGVALIGDAASTSDPTWGQGMSLALRDVRVLSESLLGCDDWTEAGHAFAEEHDRGYSITRHCDGWLTDLFLDRGPDADASRAVAFPKILRDPTRIPDVAIAGPRHPVDEETRLRLFGLD
jgi:2-polyprenyl-6-methoxyphenol hydroxylase-like FAD-dependent oxidoreductase